MLNKISLAIRLSLLFFGLCFQIAQAQKIQTRNLSVYDDGGKFDFNLGTNSQIQEKMKSKLREFLWTHWSRKTPGKVVVISYTIEGDPTTIDYYVEPDKSGQWVVAAEYEQICCVLFSLMKDNKKPVIRKGKRIYQIIERIEVFMGFDPNVKNSPKVIPNEENRNSNSYLLRLKSNDNSNAGMLPVEQF